MFDFDASEYLADIEGIEAALPGAMQEIVGELAADAVQRIKRSGLFKSRTGELIRRTYAQKSGEDFEVVADTPYAYWVENGRGPVYPGARWVNVTPAGSRETRLKRVKTGMRWLRFVIDGKVYFRRSVGPARARHFMPDGDRDDTYYMVSVERIADEILSPLWE